MALYGVALALALLIASAVMGAVLAVRDMRDQADVSLTNAKARIELSVAESFKLLESLAEQPTLYERSVWVMDKVTMLDQVNEHFGYFLLCYVDDEMNVWDVTGSASLASRDFMQKCYSTGQGLVTDSFAAGADGVTLNYVVLVAPLRRRRDDGIAVRLAVLRRYGAHPRRERRRPRCGIGAHRKPGPDDVGHVGFRVRRHVPRPASQQHRVRYDRRCRGAGADGARTRCPSGP